MRLERMTFQINMKVLTTKTNHCVYLKERRTQAKDTSDGVIEVLSVIVIHKLHHYLTNQTYYKGRR